MEATYTALIHTLQILIAITIALGMATIVSICLAIRYTIRYRHIDARVARLERLHMTCYHRLLDVERSQKPQLKIFEP
jgi:hypothetical protein